MNILILLVSFATNLIALCAQSIEILPQEKFDSLHNKVSNSFRHRDLKTAKLLIQSLDSLTEVHWTQNSSQYSLLNYNKAIYNYYRGNFTESLKNFESAMKIRKELFGEKDEYYYKCLTNSGNIYYLKGDFKTALKIYSKGLELNKEIFKKEGIHLAKDLNNIAIARKELGFYEDAEVCLLEAIRLKLKYDSTDINSLASTYNNLAILYNSIGNVKKEEEFILKGVNCLKNDSVFSKYEEFMVLNTSAGIYYNRHRDYKKAQYYLLVLEEYLKHTPSMKESYIYESYLTLKFQINQSLGNDLKAKEIQSEYLDFVLNKFGEYHFRHGLALMAIGKSLHSMEDFELSKINYFKALTVLDSIQGKNSVNSIICLIALCSNEWQSKNYNQMLKFVSEAKSRYESGNMKDTLILSSIYCYLGIAYSNLNEPALAEEFLMKSLKWRSLIIEKENEDYLSSLQELSFHFMRKNEYQKAKIYLIEASIIVKKILEQTKGFLTQEELTTYISKFEIIYYQVLSLCNLIEDNDIRAIAFENVSFYKGFIKEQKIAFNKELRTNLDYKNEYSLLRNTEQRLLKLSKVTLDDDDKKLVAQLEEKKYLIEKNILFNYENSKDNMMIDWKIYQNILDDSSAIVEFIHYNYCKEYVSDSILYAAFIIKKDLNIPLFIPLCNHNQLNKILGKHKIRRLEYVNHLYNTSKKSIPGEADNLYDLVWQHIEPHLKGIHQIDYSLSGMLHYLNIDYLVLPDKTYLSDKVYLSLHSSLKYLNNPNVTSTSDLKNEIVLFGGVDYDYDAFIDNELLVSNVNVKEFSNRSRYVDYIHTDTLMQKKRWTYLPSSKREVEKIGEICLRSNIANRVFIGKEANEEKFKSFGNYTSKLSPSVIHFSTHGYFNADLVQKLSCKNCGNGVNNSFYPMQQSGLVLAGANKAW
ncbi:MAG TPA: tetratricopeptide repeat protein, partial [Soehngenia sp.]|nr:tetratricopeptide repeat protein [Soehngenia sp.]